MHAPSTPPATPPLIHQPRCATPRVTARTIPTIRPASKTSRNTMISAASTIIPLFHDQSTAVALVEVVEEFISAGLQRADADRGLAVRRDDLFHPHRLAFELHRSRIAILHAKQDRLVGRRAHFARLKLLTLHCEFDRYVLRRRALREEQQRRPSESAGCAPRIKPDPGHVFSLEVTIALAVAKIQRPASVWRDAAKIHSGSARPDFPGHDLPPACSTPPSGTSCARAGRRELVLCKRRPR